MLSIGTNNFLRANRNDSEKTVKVDIFGDKKSSYMEIENINRRSIYEESSTIQQFLVLDSILK